ncbi:SPX domain-containing protein [Niveomyces insectorum RCEF 264]|uniref:SPX domain-containing protein n=1 Tax=Niveomyces insectorum RCEF 264 TaxID=1081102 RepID=A0A167NTR3_9HYPO|nr:SPX domain-containing protein [Niveomyces insectorum RCEF 264]
MPLVHDRALQAVDLAEEPRKTTTRDDTAPPPHRDRGIIIVTDKAAHRRGLDHHENGDPSGSYELVDFAGREKGAASSPPTTTTRRAQRQPQDHDDDDGDDEADHDNVNNSNDNDATMKFSHSIQFNAVPDWSSHYIAYSNLKKLIYQLERAVHQAAAAAGSAHADAEARPLIVPGEPDPETVFTRALDVELEKICSFYALKERELRDEVEVLLQDIGAFDEEEEQLQRHKDGQDGQDGSEGPSNDGRYEPDPAADAAGASSSGVAAAYGESSRGNGGDGEENNYGGASYKNDDDDDDDDEEDRDDRAHTPPVAVDATRLEHRQQACRRRRCNRRRNNAVAYTDMTASTTDVARSRRYSTTFEENPEDAVLFSSSIMLKKRIVHTYVQLCELKSYVQLNKTGFRKVLKKFDKILDTHLRPRYMATAVETADPFGPAAWHALVSQIAQMEAAYTAVVDGRLRQGDEEPQALPMRRFRAPRWLCCCLGRGGGRNRRVVLTLPAWLVSGTMGTLVAILALFAVLLSVPPAWVGLPRDGPAEQQNCLALLVFVSLLWATETIPLFVTSLLVPFLCVVLRVVVVHVDAGRHDPDGEYDDHDYDHDTGAVRLPAKDAAAFVFASMWTPVIMLLLGGFTLAAALSKCRIDKRIATFVLSKAGTRPRTVLLANMLVAAFASMLISNVAAPVLCFSIIECSPTQPMLRNLPSDSDMSKAVIMGIALASNIGGMLSPIASPQNVVAIGIMTPEPPWLQWLFISIPVGVVSILLIWLLLLVSFRPGRGTTIVAIRPVRERFTGVQWFVTLVTVATIALWCASHQLEQVFGDMGVVAVLPLVLFFGVGVLSKEDFNNFPWTIVVLAAGGLALGRAVEASGLLETVAAALTARVAGWGLYGVLLACSVLMLVVATFVSHTVAALILLPLVHNVGADMAPEPHANLLVMAGVLVCSAAMALPTSGFPNMTAIMKEDPAGQRYLQVKHFITRGIPSSLLSLVVVLTLGYGAMRITGM